MSTGETLLILAGVGVVGYLLYQNSKPAAPPPAQLGGYGPAPAPGVGKYDFYSQIVTESGDVARQAISAFGPSQTPPAARTAP